MKLKLSIVKKFLFPSIKIWPRSDLGFRMISYGFKFKKSVRNQIHPNEEKILCNFLNQNVHHYFNNLVTFCNSPIKMMLIQIYIVIVRACAHPMIPNGSNTTWECRLSEFPLKVVNRVVHDSAIFFICIHSRMSCNVAYDSVHDFPWELRVRQSKVALDSLGRIASKIVKSLIKPMNI